jgi:hypothetical protein
MMGNGPAPSPVWPSRTEKLNGLIRVEDEVLKKLKAFLIALGFPIARIDDVQNLGAVFGESAGSVQVWLDDPDQCGSRRHGRSGKILGAEAEAV